MMRLGVFLLPHGQDAGPLQATPPQFTGADPGFFLGGGAPLRNGVTNTNKTCFFCRLPVVLESGRASQGGVCTPCTLPLDPP